MVVTFVLMALFGLSVQAGLFAFIELDEQHVKLTNDEGEDRNIQISSNDVFCASSPAHSWRKFLGDCLRCHEDLEDEDDMLDPLLAGRCCSRLLLFVLHSDLFYLFFSLVNLLKLIFLSLFDYNLTKSK